MVLFYFVSWLINFVIIALVVAVVDESMHRKIEEHQALAAFFIFFLPTAMEVASSYYFNRPFLWNF
ncbi:hypothetical protein HYS54_00785 [Candidatus Micrarchaeota archaeon]|nr:hypothetical protein [Candidatus Micrarchaeota archaeon]